MKRASGFRMTTSHKHDSFELHVTLGDMPLADAFRVRLPVTLSKLNIGSLVEEVFSTEEDTIADVASSLDVEANPDLPEMYEELLDIFSQWRSDDCTLRFFAVHGRELHLGDPVIEHLGIPGERPAAETGERALWLVVEQTFDVLARFHDWGDGGGDLMRWLQQQTLLYFMDKHQYSLPMAPTDAADLGLSPIAGRLTEAGFITGSDSSGAYELTGEGVELIGRMVAEAESSIDRFDVFNDVVVDEDTEDVEFGTGGGMDLRVQVYDSEGLDPLRTVFLLLLYDATLDTFVDTWREDILEESFFDGLLRPVLDRAWVDDDLVGHVIESGYAHIEEVAEAAAESAFERDVQARIHST